MNNFDFKTYLPKDYSEKIHVMESTEEGYVSNEYSIKYFYLLSGFIENQILG